MVVFIFVVLLKIIYWLIVKIYKGKKNEFLYIILIKIKIENNVLLERSVKIVFNDLRYNVIYNEISYGIYLLFISRINMMYCVCLVKIWFVW